MLVRLRFKRGKQKLLLNYFMKYNGLSITSSAKLLGVGRTTLRDWLNERFTLPMEVFTKIVNSLPELKRFESEIIEKLPKNWGAVKGGIERVSKIKDIKKAMRRVREIKDKKRRKRANEIKKKLKIKNKLFIELKKNKVDLKCVLATCLLTDGSLTIEGNHYRVAYYTMDPILKDLMRNVILSLSDFVPSVIKDKDGVYAIRVSDRNLAKLLLKLSPTYKKKPSKNQSREEYLNETQPSIKFLEKCNEATRTWCIRIALSCDGCISVSKNNNFELNLTCYHPYLSKEWMALLNNYGIKGHLARRKKSWSGIDGIRAYDLESLKNFLRLGGFIPGVKITHKSKRFYGVEKNKLLKDIIDGKVLMGE